MRKRTLLVSVFCVAAAMTALAQDGATGAISGTIQDVSGAVLPGIVNQAADSVVRTLAANDRGPAQQDWDFSLSKLFSLSERQNLEFRSEFFNLWDHPSFGNPSFFDVSGPNFGEITNTVGTPRLIQFALRYSF